MPFEFVLHVLRICCMTVGRLHQRGYGADVGMCAAGGYDGYFRRPAAAAAAAAASSGEKLQKSVHIHCVLTCIVLTC